jgi:cytosine/adenosine deaminase-related metal-dependent hydrolase
MPEEPARFTRLTAARLLDGARREPVENAALLLEGAEVRGLGPRDAVRAPDGAAVQRMDYGDATILPGLVDAHITWSRPAMARRGTTWPERTTRSSFSRPPGTRGPSSTPG